MPKMPWLPLSISRINKYVINRVTGPVYKASVWCRRVPSLAEGNVKPSGGSGEATAAAATEHVH